MSNNLTSDRTKTNGVNVEGKNCCYTQTHLMKCGLEWIIEHYSIHATKEDPLKSSIFSAATDDNFMWRVELWMPVIQKYNNYANLVNINYVSFRLYPDNVDDFKKYAPITGEVKFSIRKNDNSEGGIKRQKFVLKNDNGCNGINVDFIKQSDLCGGWLSEDKLTVICDVTYVKSNDIITCSASTSAYPKHKEFEIPELSLSRDFERLFINKKFTDVTVSVKDKKYHAHKNILAARSSVFEAMFEHDMKEKTSHLIEISDMGCEVLEEMLRYIYTGKPNILEKSALDLLIAADKYDLKELKSMCETALYKRLSVDNALELLMFADTYHADQLKMQILQFIKIQTRDHEAHFMDTNVWNVLCTSRPQLVKEIITVLINHQV